MSAPHHDAKALAFTPDGAMLVSAADTGAYAGDRVLKRWDLRSGVEIGAESGRERRRNRRRRGRDMRSSMSTPHQTRPLAVTGDGRSAVSALTGSGLRVWDLATGAEIGVLLDGMVDETVHALPGRRVLAPDGYNESAAVVWDLDAREPLGRLAASGVLVLDTTADGRRAATVARNLRAVLWDLAEHRALAGITLEDFAQACVLAPDGETLVVGDRRTVHLLRVMPGSGAAPAP
jgi:WD40 repeat protein